MTTAASILNPETRPPADELRRWWFVIPDDTVPWLLTIGHDLSHRIEPALDTQGRFLVCCDTATDADTYLHPYIERGLDLDALATFDVVRDPVFPVSDPFTPESQ